MGKVKDILRTKGNKVYSVEPSIMVYEAIALMCEKNIGGLLILQNDKLEGIFTERDYARKLILKGKSSKNTPISELMTRNPITVLPETSIEDCMDLMTGKFIRHLPVVEEGRLVGLISIGDVVKHIIEEQKDIIEHLENYISR
ncbi:CBS domain-containing protein [Chryseolinea sp. H1M3-3]|jgi:CBS domain-containing protein|uniref:CBS domain-containing protein n=1 Tax=Chryseolinea sp. H1M3-3 TaxID=3034144 RepID=UPI0023EDDE99|nr:CBS domain-containing protein [Chryseolinea sp. H1M3-3]